MVASDRLWASYAGFYDSLLNSPLYVELMEQVVEALCLVPGASLLDAGCGTGNLATIVATLAEDVQTEAVDSSAAMLGVATRKTPRNTRFRQHDLGKPLPFPNDAFDAVALIHVLYALPQPVQALRELYRVLRPGGVLVVANPRPKAGVLGLIRHNLARLQPQDRPLALLRTLPLLAVNLLITASGRTGAYHFWDEETWKSHVNSLAPAGCSLRPVYGGQDYLVQIWK